MVLSSRAVRTTRFATQVWPSLEQALLLIPIFAVTEVAALVGLGMVARLAFISGGLMLAIRYWRRSPWLYLTLVFWFWTVTPLARRLIDYSTGFDAKNIVLVTPNLLSLLMAVTLLKSPRLASRSEALGAACVTVAVLYGLSVSLVVLLCHKTLVRFDNMCVRMEILTRGGEVWVWDPVQMAANHALRPMSRR